MNLYERLRDSLTRDEPSWFVRNWELPVFLIGCVLLAGIATGYERSARQFPFVFLALGAVALSGELILHALPEKYARPVRRFTSGLASDIDVSETDDEEADDEVETDDVEQPAEEAAGNELSLLVKALIPLVLFVVLSYLISFLVAVPIYVFLVFYLVGSKNYRNALIVSLFLMAATYFLFGGVMNVPVSDGELIGDLLS